MFILGDCMGKKLNGFLLTRKPKHKCLVKVRPFSSAKIRCMHDHVKPTIRDVNPDHVILHCGTNDLNSERFIYLFIYLFSIYLSLTNFISPYNQTSLPQTARLISNIRCDQQHCGMLLSLTPDI